MPLSLSDIGMKLAGLIFIAILLAKMLVICLLAVAGLLALLVERWLRRHVARSVKALSTAVRRFGARGS